MGVCKMKTVTIVELDDWTQVFINDEMVRENHRMYNSDWIEILQELGIEVETIDYID